MCSGSSVSNQSIHERTKQPTASSLLRQRRLRWFGHLHRMPSSLPVRRVFDFNPNIHGWKRPKPDGRIQSNMISILLASTPSMPPRWSMTDPSGRPLFADCQRSNPSMALKSSKSSKEEKCWRRIQDMYDGCTASVMLVSHCGECNSQ